MESESHEIRNDPHYKTLSSAHSHFSRVADAVAEFIDNSIQATQSLPDARSIKLGLDLDTHGNTDSFISILDNGDGMDKQSLSDFSVYSLDKESRGLNPSNEIASNISKFGVGAKQAGFYLGSRIHVLTSTRGSSKVWELIIDEETMKKKFLENEDVYKTSIVSHDVLPLLKCSATPSDTNTSFKTEGKYNSRLQTVVNGLFKEKMRLSEDAVPTFSSSFTLITIQLRTEIKRKLHNNESFKDLPSQLADIYHFHLHANNLPNAVARRTLERHGQNPELVLTKPIKYKTGQSGSESVSLSNLNISLLIVVSREEYKEIPLKKLNDINSRYFEKMTHSFRFDISLPDPNPPEHEVSRVQTQLGTKGVDEGERKMVQGLILYFPSEGGHESMPLQTLRQHPVLSSRTGRGKKSDRGKANIRSSGSGSSSSSRKSLRIEDSSDEDEVEDEEGEEEIIFVEHEDLTDDDDYGPLIRIYWQNRLVPETTLNRLSFFPDFKSVTQCQKLGVPPLWRNRIKCFLFFDANFHNISNNKLKINVDPDLQTWITSPQVVKNSLLYPKNAKYVKELFPRWLKSCSDKFDQEYVYSRSVWRDIGDVKRCYLKSADSKHLEDTATMQLFDLLTFSASDGSTTLEVGENVKISLTAADVKKQSATGGGRKKVVMGHILGFVRFCHLSRDQTDSSGQGYIWYRQVPSRVFGDSEKAEHVVSTTCLDLANAANLRVTDEDLLNVEKQAPCKVRVEIYHRPHVVRARSLAPALDSNIEGEEEPEETGVTKKEYFKKEHIDDVSRMYGFDLFAAEPADITVTVLNASNKLVLSRPDDPSKKYSVRVYAKKEAKMFKDFKKSDPTALYAKKVDRVTKSVSFDKYRAGESKDSDAVHYFNKIQFSRSDVKELTLHVDVMDGTTVVYSKEFQVKISAGPVTQFSIARSPFYNENKPVVVQTGSFIPSFSLCFRDDGGNESSSFKLPTEGSVGDDVEEGRNEDEVPYWIKIKSRDDGLVVEFVDEKDHYLPHYTVPKELVKDEITIQPERFLPLPPIEDHADGDSVRRVLAGVAKQLESEQLQSWKDIGLRSPFISCTAVDRKVVVFDVTTNLCPGVTQSFTMTFTPGFPAQLCILDLFLGENGTHMTVENGSEIPPFTVACFDNYHNRTEPPQDEDWTIKLSEGPHIQSPNEEFPVRSGGRAVLSGLIMNTPIQEDNMIVQKLELIWPSENLLSQGAPMPYCNLKALVMPGKRPDRIEILNHGRSITSLTISACVGSVLDGISLRVIDETGAEWHNSEGWPVEVQGNWQYSPSSRMRGPGRKALTQSQAAQCLQGPVSTLDDVADLELPGVIETCEPLEFSVACSIDSSTGLLELEGDFQVELQPDEAVRWHILLNEACGEGRGGGAEGRAEAGLHIRCDDEEDLSAMIRGVRAIDKYGNPSSKYSGNSLPVPTLLVKWDDDLVTDQDFLECLPSSSSALIPQSEAWVSCTSKDHRCRHSFGLALEQKNFALSQPESTKSTEVAMYVVQSSAAWTGDGEDDNILPNTIISKDLSHSSSRSFWMYCIDPNRALSFSESVAGIVSPGMPVAVRLFSESIMDPSPSPTSSDAVERLGNEAEDIPPCDSGVPVLEPMLAMTSRGVGKKELLNVPFTRNSKLTDLQVLLVDSCENVVNMKKLSDRIRDMVVKIEFDPSIIDPDQNSRPQDVISEHAKTVTSKNIKHTLKDTRVTLKVEFEEIFIWLDRHTTLREGTSTDLICSASYHRVVATDLSKGDKKKRPVQKHTLASTGIVATTGGDEGPRQGSKVTLDSARLNCCFKKLDLVTSINVRAVVDSEVGIDTVSTVDSDTPFSLQVVLTSEDSNFITEPRLSDIAMAVKYSESGGRASSPYDMEDVDDFLAAGRIIPVQNGSMERIIEYPVIDSIHKRGIYSFKFVYNETRDHLVCESVRSMLSASRLKVNTTFSLNVTAGPGRYLLPSPATEPLLHGQKALKGKKGNSRFGILEQDAAVVHNGEICVSDSASASPQERRLIPENQFVEMCLYDKFGNATNFPPSKDYVCVCQVKHQRGYNNENHPNYITTQGKDSSVTALRLPLLEGNENGYLKGVSMSSDACKFSHLALERFSAREGGQGADGYLELVFRLLATEAVECSNIPPVREKLEVTGHKVKFRYTSDEANVQSLHQLQQQLEPLNDRLNELEREIHDQETVHQEAIAKLERHLGECKDLELKSYQNQQSLLTAEELRTLEKGYLDTQRAIHSRSQLGGTQHCRNSFKDPSQELLTPSSKRGFVGHVVDLAWVTDEREALLLSWAAGAMAMDGKSVSSSSSRKKSTNGSSGGGFMKALVYANDSDARKLKRLGAYFPLDKMVSVRPELLEREGLADNSELSLPLIETRKGSRIPGNPRHMVNVLSMDAEGPHDLRGTVFYAIFKNKIIINSNADAEKYLAFLHEERVADKPFIYTLMEGRCYRGDGLVTPNDTMPAKLDFVFGAPDGTGLRDINADLEKLVDIKSDLTRRDDAVRRLETLKDDEQNTRAEIDHINREAKDGNQGKRLRHKGGEEGVVEDEEDTHPQTKRMRTALSMYNESMDN